MSARRLSLPLLLVLSIVPAGGRLNGVRRHPMQWLKASSLCQIYWWHCNPPPPTPPPTASPTNSASPSTIPTSKPSSRPSSQPSLRPSFGPSVSFQPSEELSNQPSSQPSASIPPTPSPTTSPSYSLEPTSSPSFELKTFTTTFESNRTYAGNMFEIVAKNNITISNLGIHTYVTEFMLNVQIYTRVGSYRGVENDITQWILVTNTTVQGQDVGTPTMLAEAFDPPILIRQNQRQSFYVTTNGPWLRSTQGTVEGEEIYNNSDISFYQGVGKKYPMTSGTFPARIWNGLIQYRIVDDPNSDSAVLNEVAFRRGDLAVPLPDIGIKVCTGMSARVIARANQRVALADGSLSNIPFHSMPDGAAIFSLDDGGYVYVSNAEMKQNLGGVYGVYFDNHGNVVGYKELLSGTRRNCSGGKTPWDSWVSCEEYGRGQCWQVDPKGEIPSQITKLGGAGGNYESVAVDNRIPHLPIFFVTEDSLRGALRKYTPPIMFEGNSTVNTTSGSWDTLHAEGGTTEYLTFLDGNKFEWTKDEVKARDSQEQHFRNLEGIDYADGHLYFVSKKLNMLFILDLDKGTYTSSSTKDGVLAGDGQFHDSPDQLVSIGGEYLYLTEDGGRTAGIYAIHKPTGQRYAIFEAVDLKYRHDEVTGLAFSLDGNKMYASFQDCGPQCKDSEGGLDYNCGCLLEFSRTDGRSFDGSTLSLKFHAS